MNKKDCNVEAFARVTGFFRPVQSWNNGKREEFKDRTKYGLDIAEEHINSRAVKALAR